MMKRALVLAPLLAFGPLLALGTASAETAPATATVPAESKADTDLQGFRSARFGMTEDEVLAAIKTDFALSGDAVQIGQNTAERTRVITITVKDVLADGGASQISYIFGYKSKTLIQVGLLWSAAVDPSLTDAMIYANGDTLRAFFETAGYLPETITRNAVVDSGILLFRGSDAQGHTAILLLQGSFAERDGKRELTPEALTLLYAENPDKPDVLQIESGDF